MLIKSKLSKNWFTNLSYTIVLASWIKMPFYGFFPFHDGFIFVLIKFTRESLLNGGPWPWNQYGLFWSFPYVASTLAFDYKYQFLAIRITAILIYLITTIMLFTFSKKYYGKQLAHVATLIFLSFVPFGFDLLPWPSTVNMILTIAIIVAVFAVLDLESSYKKTYILKLIYLSTLSVAMIFTRFQIGILYFAFILLLFWLKHSILYLKLYLISSTLLTLSFLVFFQAKGWLGDALFDQLIFSQSYLKDGIAFIPIPKGTILFILIFAITYTLTHRLIGLKKSLKTYPISSHTLLLAFIFFLFYVLFKFEFGSTNVTSFLSWVRGRITVSFIIFVVLVHTFRLIKKIFLARDKRRLFISSIILEFALIGFSAISLVQIYPFFDPFHAWWGSVPGVILIVQFIRSEAIFFGYDIKAGFILQKVFVVLIIIAYILPLFLQRNNFPAPFDAVNFKGIYVSQTAALDANSKKRFFLKNLKSNSSVLNLCEDVDVFFAESQIRSASRFFVYYHNFSRISEVWNNMRKSDPNFIVRCYSESNSSWDTEKNYEHNRLINELGSSFIVLDKLIESDGRVWEILGKR